MGLRHGFFKCRLPARILLIAGITIFVVVALPLGVPSRISHAWNQFKSPSASPGARARWPGTAMRVAKVDTSIGRSESRRRVPEGRLREGSGLGSYQLVWVPRASVSGYTTNAHFLCVETLAEDGIVGLVSLVGFLVLAVGAALAAVARSRLAPTPTLGT